MTRWLANFKWFRKFIGGRWARHPDLNVWAPFNDDSDDEYAFYMYRDVQKFETEEYH